MSAGAGALMSVSLTTDAVRARRKTVTRRMGWRKLKAGDRLQLCVKVMGRRKGEPLEKICTVEVVHVSRVRLDTITPAEVAREGLWERAVAEVGPGDPDAACRWFVRFFCASHKGCEPDSIVTRIEWRYLDGPG